MIEEGQFKKAIEQLTVAIRNDPENPDLYLWIGIAYYKTGRDQEAEESFHAALKLKPVDARIHYNRGALYFREKKWDQAITSFLQAANLAPDWKAHSYLNIGLIYYKQGRDEEAISWFQKTLQENPAAPTQQMALEMIDLLSTMKQPVKNGTWNVQVSMGREFDTNVFLTSAEQVATRKEDWATAGTFYLNYRLPIYENLFFLSPGYYLSGRWYDSEGLDYNYLLHDLLLFIESPSLGIHPRLGYSYIYTHLGNRPFLEIHQFSFNSQIFRFGNHVIKLDGIFSIDNARDQGYNYLSGNEWKIGLSDTTSLYKNLGYIYLALVISRINLSDFRSPAQFSSYSYDAIEPSIQTQFPLLERVQVKGLFSYQHRSYHDEDIWSTGRKKRRDERFTAGLSVLRPVFKYLEAEIKYWVQITQSNIGDDPGDYADRDYRKGIYSLSLKAAF
ncbi:MAG: tetratricopeptide repeat protein [Nitrospirae bacterium]|nr:tetratricopeptide repeat protein [Nitrospirota bacterium]